MLLIEPALNVALRIDYVENGVSVRLFSSCEDSDIEPLANLVQKLIKLRPFVHVK